MSTVEESIEVRADTQRLYEMLTEFEHYPEFVPGLTEVQRTGETLFHWISDWDGNRHEWDTQVVEMVPEQTIAFQSLHTDPPVRCTLTFQAVNAGTRISYRLENDPGGDSQVRATIHQSLERLKEIAEQGPPTKWPSERPGGV